MNVINMNISISQSARLCVLYESLTMTVVMLVVLTSWVHLSVMVRGEGRQQHVMCQTNLRQVVRQLRLHCKKKASGKGLGTKQYYCCRRSGSKRFLRLICYEDTCKIIINVDLSSHQRFFIYNTRTCTSLHKFLTRIQTMCYVGIFFLFDNS